MSAIWEQFLVNPLLNLLVALYQLVGNLGVAIILLTFIVRLVLVPIVVPSMRNMKKQRELQPKIDKLKKKHKNDKQKLAQAQMELFKEHGINPASSCLSQLPMFLILIALYSVIRKIALIEHPVDLNPSIYLESLKFTADSINTTFLHLDMAVPEKFPNSVAVLAGLFQFLSSKLTMGVSNQGVEAAKKTPAPQDDIAYNVQQQMLYVMPVVTVVIAATLPSGVALYIMTTSIFSFVQAIFMFGDKSKPYYGLFS